MEFQEGSSWKPEKRPCLMRRVNGDSPLALAKLKGGPSLWCSRSIFNCKSKYIVDTSNPQPLFREERTVTDAEFCQGFEILLVSTSNCVFLSTFNAETTVSRRVWLDLYHKRGIHERRSMDANESVRLQLFCHPRD